MKNKLFCAFIFTCLGASAPAAPLEFDFKDPKGVNNIVFKTDAPLESINGVATGISGKVTFDPDNPGAVKGKIVVQASSLHLGNPMQKEHLHGDKWLDVAKYPEITFEVESAKNVKTQGNVTTADVTGKFSLHGVTKTTVTRWQRDPVTEIDGPVVEKKFVPGLDLVAVCLTCALALFIASLLVSKTKNKPVSSSS